MGNASDRRERERGGHFVVYSSSSSSSFLISFMIPSLGPFITPLLLCVYFVFLSIYWAIMMNSLVG